MDVKLKWQACFVFRVFLLETKTVSGYCCKELIVPHCNSVLPECSLLVVPVITKSGIGGLQLSGSSLWNHLPLWVQGAYTLSTFKSRLKTFLFDKAYS